MPLAALVLVADASLIEAHARKQIGRRSLDAELGCPGGTSLLMVMLCEHAYVSYCNASLDPGGPSAEWTFDHTARISKFYAVYRT